MTTIRLENEISADVVNAIKSLLKKVPKELYSIDESADYISDEDKKELKEIYELCKSGKMEFFTLDEVYESTQKVIEKYL